MTYICMPSNVFEVIVLFYSANPIIRHYNSELSKLGGRRGRGEVQHITLHHFTRIEKMVLTWNVNSSKGKVITIYVLVVI